MEDTEQTTGQPIDWLEMARDAYSTSTTYFDSSVRADIERDLRQFQGKHPSGSKYDSEAYRGRSKLFRPKTRSTIRKNEAVAAEALFSNQDVLSITAENANDPLQTAAAELMQEIVQIRMTDGSIPWFLVSIGAYQDAQAVGVVVSHQYWEYDERKGKDRPVIDLLPVENLRIDPAANWADPINTSPYVIHLMPMYVKDVKAKMAGGETPWIAASEETIRSAAKPSGDTTRMTREGSRQDSKDQSSAITDFTIVWVHCNIIEYDGIDYIYYTLGTEHLLSNPVPLDTVYYSGKRPYVMGICAIETHKLYVSGVSRLTRDTQAEINSLANLRQDNIALALNKRYWVKRNRAVDVRSLTRNIPNSVTFMDDPERDVVAHEFKDVTGSSFQEHDRLNNDFDDVSGAFSNASIQANRKLNETVGGMNLLSTNANQVSAYQLRTFVETWVEPVLRQVVQLVADHESDESLLELAVSRSGIEEKHGMAFDWTLLEQPVILSVNVGMGATNPKENLANFLSGMQTLRDLLADGVLEKYGMKIDEVIKEVFGKLGFKGGSRFFGTEEDPSLTAAKQTIQQLQQELSVKSNPELIAAQVRKIDAEIGNLIAAKVKTGTEAAFSAMQAAQVVAAVPQVTPVADEILKGAGYQPVSGGVDPDLPQPAAPMMAPEQMIGGMPGDPSPNTPAGAGVGAMQGIETIEADSV